MSTYLIMKSIFNGIICLICVVCISFSCGRPDTDTEELKDEVIAIHDEVMPKMGELKSMRKDILRISESLKESDSATNAEKVQELETLADRMNQAFDGMFVWMRQYRSSPEEMSDIEYREYLLDQKLKVKEVNFEIKSVMSEARLVLDSNY